jgi:TonB family protein
MTLLITIQNLLSSKRLVNLLPFALLLFIFQINTSAQTSANKDVVLIVADEMPSFPGGPKALMDNVYKNVTYPLDAREKGIEGTVIVRFEIDKEGNVKQPTISKGLYPSIDNSVLAAVNKIPKFIPGKVDGKPVNVWYALPIKFKIG